MVRGGKYGDIVLVKSLWGHCVKRTWGHCVMGQWVLYVKERRKRQCYFKESGTVTLGLKEVRI